MEVHQRGGPRVASHRCGSAAGCPFCSGHRPSVTTNLAVRFPRVAAEWHPTKNRPLTASQVMPFAERKVWWRCREGHDWDAAVSHRSSGEGRPYCSGHRVSPTNSLAARAPKTQSVHLRCAFCCNRRLSVTNRLSSVAPAVSREWHPTRNGAITPRDVVYSSNRRAWWRCARGHVWATRISQRTVRGNGCPVCNAGGRKRASPA